LIWIGLSCNESYIWLLILGDVFGGIGGGGRLGGFRWIGVLSGCKHWLINGIIDVDDDKVFVDFDDREWISFVDFERLRIIPLVFIGEISGGEVDLVRKIFSSLLLLLAWRKEEWNDDERVNDVFDIFGRSNQKKTKIISNLSSVFKFYNSQNLLKQTRQDFHLKSDAYQRMIGRVR
jgi:hypothetical protein